MGHRSRANGAAVVIIDFPVKSDCELKLQSERPMITDETMALRGLVEKGPDGGDPGGVHPGHLDPLG